MKPVDLTTLPDLGCHASHVGSRPVPALRVVVGSSAPPMPVWIWRDGARVRESVDGYEHYVDVWRGVTYYAIVLWREVWSEWERRA